MSVCSNVFSNNETPLFAASELRYHRDIGSSIRVNRFLGNLGPNRSRIFCFPGLTTVALKLFCNFSIFIFMTETVQYISQGLATNMSPNVTQWDDF